MSQQSRFERTDKDKEGNTYGYIGSYILSQTGDSQFFNQLKILWTLEKVVEHPNFIGVYSKCYFYSRTVIFLKLNLPSKPNLHDKIVKFISFNAVFIAFG